ncbi:MAG TPA: carboxypeptidase-like regulatory domain-containing protein, partial [Chryseolinea sp.]|nr:carboxypeptidase-like regulatory domain-containing protein [Chryseolinea sp.]
MKTLLLFFLLTIIMTLQVSSQQGKLINEDTKLPIDGATVLVRPSGQTVITNESGNFSFGSSSEEIDSIFISSIGYQSRWIHASEFKFNKGLISVPRAAVDLATVSIITNPGDQFKPISQLDISMRPVNNSQMVLPMVPGLFIGQHAGGGKAEQIFLRGFDLDH